MNIVVLGSTGGIGRQVVEQALSAGHRVTAVVRGEARVSVNPALRVVRADVTDGDALRPVVAGADAVVSALGRRPRDNANIQGDAAAALVAAAPMGTRALFVGASAMYSDSGDRPWTRWLAKPLLRWVLRSSYADTARMEAIVEQSELRWTLVRPSRLTDQELTGSFRSAVDRNLPGGAKISRADVAAAMLNLVDAPPVVGHAVYVAY
jgi:putative NADH-flavin reductase